MGLLSEFTAWYRGIAGTELAVALVAIVAGTVMIGALSWMCILSNSELMRSIRNDFELKARAKNGTAILLTAEQFIALSQADPKTYDPQLVEERFELGESKVILLSREMSKLDRYVIDKQTEQRLSEIAKQEAKERQATIKELQDIRDKLGKHIDYINKANAARAKVMVEQSHNLVSAVINGQSVCESGDTEPATQGIKEAELG